MVPGRINKLTVTPTEVCPNDSVEVTWSAEGSPVSLEQDPPMSLTAPRQSAEGIQTLSGDRDFDVVLEARGRPDATERRYVHVITEGWTFVITGPRTCRDDEIRVEAEFHLRDPQIDARLQLTTVTARSDRPLTIRHGELPPVTIPPGSTSTMRGARLSGQWTLTAKLKPGERCDGDAPLAPAVIVSGTCGGMPPLVQRSTAMEAAPRCGNLGQRCCSEGTCQGGYRCEAGRYPTCLDPQRPPSLLTGRRCSQLPATADSRLFVVAVRDQNGCGETFTGLADSREEANECARHAVVGATAIMEGYPRRFDLCRDGRVRVFVSSFSDADALTCGRRRWPAAQLEAGTCG